MRVDLYRPWPDGYMAKLVFQIIQINSWNRLAVTSHLPVGDDVSRKGNSDG